MKHEDEEEKHRDNGERKLNFKDIALKMHLFVTCYATIYFQEQKKDVELSKDNLKTFIERWEEHPNSPYVFDVESNVIMPLKDSSRNSISSSRGEYSL